MIANELPNQEELRAMLDYDPESGSLIWKSRADRDAQWNGRMAGKKAGSKHRGGYIRLHINDKQYSAHRVIYKLAYGSIPNDMQIDHIDGDKINNRLENLRLVNNSQNQSNRRPDTGKEFKGVYKHREKYKAEIIHMGTRVYLGVFDSARVAAFAYDEAAREYHGEHAFLNFPEIQEAM